MPHNVIRVIGAREHNLKNITVDIPRDQLVVITGLSRLGKKFAGIRHDLCRGAAPLCRVTLSIRAPVSRTDGKTRCRLDRWTLTGCIDRSKGYFAQPAFDGRHGDRGLRLSTPAVRSNWHPALHGLRTRGGAPVCPGDRQIIERMPEGSRLLLLAPIAVGKAPTRQPSTKSR